MLQVQEMYAAALAEDPNAFDYDGVYDSIQQEKAAPKAQDKVARQPKYIANLLEQAQQRKREQDITNERRLVSCLAIC
jgi:coiled-coil domain-containing protein 55